MALAAVSLTVGIPGATPARLGGLWPLHDLDLTAVLKRRASAARPPVSSMETLAVEVAEDAALMARLQAGDNAALEALYHRHGPAVRRFAYRMTQDATLADDAMQNTFVSLSVARHRFRPGASVKTWILAIAANAVRDDLRRQKKLHDQAHPGLALVVDAPMRDAPLEQCIHRALAQLPEAQRVAIVLHRFEGLDFAEISNVLGTPVTTVKVRAHRGYQKLRELLASVWEEIQ